MTLGYGGQGWIKANFSNGASVQKNVWIGSPEVPSSLEGPNAVHNGEIVNYFGGTARGATHYKWEPPTPFTVTSTLNINSMAWNMTPTTGQHLNVMAGQMGAEGTLKYRGVNACGDGFPFSMYISRLAGCGPGLSICDDPFDFGDDLFGDSQSDNPVKTYPVPADSQLNIDLSFVKAADPITVQIYNHYGRLVLQEKTSLKTLRLNTRDLKDGNYILKIKNSKHNINKMIIVQH